MKRKTFPIDFIRQGGMTYPANPELHSLAVQFCEREVKQPFNMADFSKTLVTCEVNDEGVPVQVLAISCEQVVSDWPVIRFTDKEAGDLLMERMRSYLQDRGLSGVNIFVHVAAREPKESRCPAWKQFLKKQGAESASRWTVKV